MTLANKITISRFLLIPIMIVFIYLDLGTIEFITTMQLNQFIFAILFVVASLSDFLDGYVARKRNEITTFGKFLDPIADKVLVMAAALYLLSINPQRITVWTVMIIIFREFLVSALRMLASEKGQVISASIYGKAKTMTTLIALIVLLFDDFGLPHYVGDALWYIAIILTVISGLEYVLKNRKIILESI